MTKNSSQRSQSVKPSQLKVGDIIRHNEQQAEVVKISNWSDRIHGVVYGLDLEIKGKNVRASYSESSTVELVA